MADLATLLAAEDWGKAEKLLRRAAGAKGAPASVFYNLAKVLETAGKDAQRVTWLKRAVGRDPAYAIAWFELGRALQAEGQLGAAASAFERAVDLNSADAAARLAWARLALRLGHWPAVVAALGDIATVEAGILRYRARAEMGEATDADRAALLAEMLDRPAVLRALTRVAKGSLPLRI